MPRRPGDRRPTHAERRWADQDADFRSYAAAGLTAQEIAQLLGRSIAAVKTRAHAIGVTLAANTRRPIARKKNGTRRKS